MYFTLHYDIRNGNPEFMIKSTDLIKAKLKGMYWVKPLRSLFIINCGDDILRKSIIKDLTEYSKANDNNLIFLISPLIDSGQYSGVAAKDLWDHIKDITKRDYYGW